MLFFPDLVSLNLLHTLKKVVEALKKKISQWYLAFLHRSVHSHVYTTSRPTITSHHPPLTSRSTSLTVTAMIWCNFVVILDNWIIYIGMFNVLHKGAWTGTLKLCGYKLTCIEENCLSVRDSETCKYVSNLTNVNPVNSPFQHPLTKHQHWKNRS